MMNNTGFSNLREMITYSCNLYGSEVAYKIKDENNSIKNYTYNDVWSYIEALGTSLIAMDLKGKKIAVMGNNTMEWELAYLSVVCGVGIVVPIDKTLPANELSDVIKRSGVEAIFCNEKNVDVLKSIKFNKENNLKKIISMDAKKHNQGIYSIWALIDNGKFLLKENYDLFEKAVVDPYAISIMLFTSGTTSRSKIVALSQYNICSNLIALDKIYDISCEDVFLSFLPLHHVFECTVGFLFPLSKGAKIAFAEGVGRIVNNLKEYRVSFFACVPAVYEKLFIHVRRSLEKKGLMDESLIEIHKQDSMEEKKRVFSFIHDLLGGNIRYFICGAAPLDIDMEQRFRNVGINLMQAYGLTETSPVVASGRDDSYRLGSVGKALPGIEVEVENCDESGIGELMVKGPNVMLGYYNDSDQTLQPVEDGWFHTGDLARIDEDGYIFICGRKKNVIVLKNGKNVFPEEIEQMVNKIVGVQECIVYGRQHSKSKDDVRVFVKIVYDAKIMKRMYNAETEQQIYKAFVNEIKTLNSTLPSYKAIRGITLTEEPFEKTSTNKIKRNL